MKRRIFQVSLNMPNGVTVAVMRDYIETEIKAGIGAYSPDDPIFNLDRDSVEVLSMGLLNSDVAVTEIPLVCTACGRRHRGKTRRCELTYP